jgi:hypothetical protein
MSMEFLFRNIVTSEIPHRPGSLVLMNCEAFVSIHESETPRPGKFPEVYRNDVFDTQSPQATGKCGTCPLPFLTEPSMGKLVCKHDIIHLECLFWGKHTFLEREIARLTLFNNLLTHNWQLHTWRFLTYLSVLIFKWEENRSTLEVHETQVQALTIRRLSVARDNELTACATCASLMQPTTVEPPSLHAYYT